MSDIVFEIKLEKFNNINDIILLIGNYVLQNLS